jgi:hypothetical protein
MAAAPAGTQTQAQGQAKTQGQAEAKAKPQGQARVRPQVKTVQPQARTQVQAKALPLALAAPSVPEGLRPYVTQWGLDPLWRSGDTSTPEYPLAADFKTAVNVMHNLTINELPGVRRFTAVGHSVKFDEDRGLWYCDLEIAPKDAYYPFLRLALARFQPNSVAGAHLSRVVIADFIQLVPGRSVTVVPDRVGAAAKSLTVTVSGVSYIQTSAGVAPADIEASLETRSPDVPGDLGWVAVAGSTVELKAQRVATLAPGHFNWAGKVNLPAARGAKPYRLVIREFETFISDEVEKPAKPTLTVAAVPKKVRRLVFAEAVEL